MNKFLNIIMKLYNSYYINIITKVILDKIKEILKMIKNNLKNNSILIKFLLNIYLGYSFNLFY